MNQHTLTIMEVGSRFGSPDDLTGRLMRTIPRAYFRELFKGRFNQFDFLSGLPFSDAINFIKGLVMCENHHVSPYPGSTSLVIWSFNAVQRRSQAEWTKIAVWIVQNHDNPFSPFNFRRTRDHWEFAMWQSDDPIQIASRADELEFLYQTRKHAIAERQTVRERIAKLRKGDVPKSPEIRQRIIEELEREAGWPELRK